MGRYFFNIVETGVQDTIGEVFADEAAAKVEALESAREILREGGVS